MLTLSDYNGMEYKNGKVYKIVSNKTDKIYVGSTCSLLSKRLYGHRSSYEMFKRGIGHYITSFDILEHEDAEIILVENYPCKDKNELHARERYWIEKFKDIVVNKNIPTRTTKEWNEDNHHHVSVQKRKYRLSEANKERRRNLLYKQMGIPLPEKQIRMSQKHFDFLFMCDSYMRMPRTYPNFIVS